MRIPIAEQETIIRWYRDEREATVYTSDLTMMTRFDKFVEGGDWEFVKQETHEGNIISKTYKAPKELVHGRKSRPKREYTEEQREAIGKRLSSSRNK